MRFRDIFLGIGGFLTIFVLLLSDPDTNMLKALPFGAGALSTIIILVTSILFIGLLHLARKGLLDYLDLQVLFTKALETAQGAGLAIVGVGLIMIAIAVVILAAVK